MSDVSQGPGWWQASDGKWYSPESVPGVADSRSRNVPMKPRQGPVKALGFGGAAAALVGIYFAAGLSSSHSLCNSTLGGLGQGFSSQAANDCTLANGLYYLGIVMVAFGGVMVVGAIALIVRNQGAVPTQWTDATTPKSASPGWYPLPDRQLEMGYWNGTAWVPESFRSAHGQGEV